MLLRFASFYCNPSSMKRPILHRAQKISAVLVLAISSILVGKSAPLVIYGTDGRIEPTEADERMQNWARATAAMIPQGRLEKSSLVSERTHVITCEYGKFEEVCKDEPFYGQPESASCSGFLVGPDLLMTAGHCIENMHECYQYSWVFGFDMKTLHETNDISVPSEDVYQCAEVIAHGVMPAPGSDTPYTKDYTLLRLNRKVTGRTPLEVRKTGKVAVGEKLVLIGNPSGIATKIALGGKVRENNRLDYFRGTLDAYHINSGSAVINEKTGLVEGILVGGEEDFIYDSVRKCNKSKRCAEDKCKGEAVTRISVVLPELEKALQAY